MEHKLEVLNKALLVVAIPVFGYAAYSYLAFEIEMRRLNRKLSESRDALKDPFAGFSPEAKRVLYGR